MGRPQMARRLRYGTLAALAALLLLASAGIATAGGGTGQDGVFKMLHTRGGTIGCQYASGGSLPQAVLRCDIKGGLHPRPPRPTSCAPNPDFDTVWAVGILLQTKGKAQVVCAGDTTLGARGQLLRRGSLWQAGGISCHATAPQTLICQNAHGHGFLLSPSRWRVF
jgi:hypothetical protein